MENSSPIAGSSHARYALITPVRDEEKYIGEMIESILAQSVRPTKWIIVDDGSSDNTIEIIESYARHAKVIEIIKLPQRHQRAAGGEGAITHALQRLEISNYDFLARFDADLLFEPGYIGEILSEFERDPKLGIAGGGLWIEKSGSLKLEKVPECHVRGALKMYRRQCFEQVGGITTGIGWDTIDEVYAWTKGWKTKSFFKYRVIHRRPTGDGIRASRIYWERGKAEYFTWSHPLFVAGKTVKLAAEKLSLLKPFAFLAGFVSCYLRSELRLQDPVFVKVRRGQQLQRVAMLRGSRCTNQLCEKHVKHPRQSTTL